MGTDPLLQVMPCRKAVVVDDARLTAEMALSARPATILSIFGATSAGIPKVVVVFFG
jgi:hypothetical protein